MFWSRLHSVGNTFSPETPVPKGPRHCGQFSPHASIQSRTESAGSPRIATSCLVIIARRRGGRLRNIEGAPGLAVEILSPEDNHTGIRRKMRRYFTGRCEKRLGCVPVESQSLERFPETGQRALRDGAVTGGASPAAGISLRFSRLFE